ncbi:YCII-related domain-containing protein [Duganella sacchari]|uniref:YCII-related domain-containing protein n=1 Tax=Duganella sacchari TaxID=551987 RepID=A0A1M7LAM8_9BURK|nr:MULTISPECIES: YciI family protein [Duganella]MYM28107.1 hypothetical protein [Duganella sp. CY15W]SHM74853.1 YCII-related domain-containing protein [Duganella sacchari]
MNEYILLMHDDVQDAAKASDNSLWGDYIRQLHASGQFDGGSSIGHGAAFKQGQAGALTPLTGYIRIRADSLEAARHFLAGNPTYEAGGTVEIRELPREE